MNGSSIMASDAPRVGDRASLTHVFSADDVAAFAGLSGDTNPVHLDAGAARAMGFEGPIAHGMLAASLISRVLGTELPGSGTIYLSQELRFRKPIYPGDRVLVEVEVLSARADKPIYELSTQLSTDEGLAIDGKAVVLVRSSP